MDIATFKIDETSVRNAVAGIDGVDLRRRTCDEYGLHFGKNVETVPAISDTLRFLAIICSWRLKADDLQRPFDCLWHESTWENLTDEQLDVLAVVAPTIGDAELRTRLCDIVWLRKRSHTHARLAAEGYVACAEQLIAGQLFLGERECLTRAIQLASLVDRGGNLFNDLVRRIEGIAGRQGLAHCTVATCLTVLWNARCGDRSSCYQLATDRAAAIRRSDPNLHWERTFWDLAAHFAGANDDRTAQKAALLESAGTYERQAMQAPGKAAAAHFWELAVHAYRNIPGTQNERDRCHRELLAAQEHLRDEMIPLLCEPIDISKLVGQARERIQRKDMGRALAELVFATRWHLKSYLREQAEAGIRAYPFQHMFGSVQFGGTGKVASTTPGTGVGPSDIAPERLHAEMCRQYHIFIPIVVSGTIEPMRNELLREHNVTLDDVVAFLHQSPWIPHGRLLLFAVGIHAGLSGRFIEALHVLIPQVEHVLRFALEGRNVITSRLDSDGIQEELDLNRLLVMPETEALLGEDLHFAVRVLLVERYGFNLRNYLCHGMLSSGAFASTAAVYTWWLIFHMVARPVAEAIIAQRDDLSNEATRQPDQDATGGDT